MSFRERCLIRQLYSTERLLTSLAAFGRVRKTAKVQWWDVFHQTQPGNPELIGPTPGRLLHLRHGVDTMRGCSADRAERNGGRRRSRGSGVWVRPCASVVESSERQIGLIELRSEQHDRRKRRRGVVREIRSTMRPLHVFNEKEPRSCLPAANLHPEVFAA